MPVTSNCVLVSREARYRALGYLVPRHAIRVLGYEPVYLTANYTFIALLGVRAHSELVDYFLP